MKWIFCLPLMLCLTALVAVTHAAPTQDAVKTKEALRELQDFIGGWKGSGGNKARPGPRDPVWSETVKWNWRFKGDKIWLNVEFEGGKFLKSADISYLLDKKKYELVGTPAEGKDKLTFIGELKDDKLIFERTDSKTKEVQRLRMNTAAEGLRFIYQVDTRNSGGTIWKLSHMVATTKIGESIAGTSKKGPECVVSGGLGTSTVSYNGETFYVCCSGCAEAFKENPKKYVDEFKAKKKK